MRIFKLCIMMAIFALLVSTGTRANAASNLLLDEAIPVAVVEGDLATEPAQDVTNDVVTSVSEPEVLTLEMALQASFDNNRNIELARQAIELTKAGGQAGLVGFLPDLNMIFSFTRNLKSETVDIPDVGEFEMTPIASWYGAINFRYPIWHNGERDAIVRQNAASEEISESELEIARAMIAYAATDAFCSAREGYGGLAVRQASLAHLTELERQVQAMYDAGYVALSDLLSVQVARSQAELQVVEWTNNIQIRMTYLNLIMGEDVATRWTIVPIDYPIVEIPFSQETLTEWALENRPELKQLRAERARLEAQMDGIRSSTGPQVDFEASYSQRSAGGLSTGSETVSGTINFWWDLYNFGKTDDLLGPLEAQMAMLDIREVEQDQRIRSEVEQAMLSLNTQLQNVNVTNQAVAQAEEALRVSQRRMEEGLGLMVEVLNAQATWTTLGAQSVFATHMYYRLLAALSGAVAVDPRDLITLIEVSGGQNAPESN